MNWEKLDPHASYVVETTTFKTETSSKIPRLETSNLWFLLKFFEKISFPLLR